MQQPYQDSYCQTFNSMALMMDYHRSQTSNSRWKRMPVHSLHVLPLEQHNLPEYSNLPFAEPVSLEAIEDTTKNLGLAAETPDGLYPFRDTAYRTLLDRAKISGTVLKRFTRTELADTLNLCLQKHKSDALLLIRDEKISAVLGGDEQDYSVLTIDALMDALKEHLERNFPGYKFADGYTDHSITTAMWTLNGQRKALLSRYEKALDAHGRKGQADRLMPGIRFITSDVGAASASVSAMLMGGKQPIRIGEVVAVKHRQQSDIAAFKKGLDMLMAQFSDVVGKLEALLDVYLNYPVDAMLAICKKFRLPKKAALNAVEMFAQSIGDAPTSAHDVYIALQEVLFLLQCENTPKSRMLDVEEAIVRTLNLRWEDYDLPRAGEY